MLRFHRLFMATVVAMMLATFARAAAKNCDDGSLTASSGFTVRSWKVETRWGTTAVLSSRFTAGQPFSPATVSDAVDEVRKALQPQTELGLGSTGGYSVLFVGSCVEKVGPNQVDVTVQPYLIRVDLVKIGSNVLPVPRFNQPAAPTSTPSPLAKLNPTFGLSNDRRVGVGEDLAFSTDLLHLASGDSPAAPPNTVMVEGNGNKALNNSFYDGKIQLGWSRQQETKTLRKFSVTSSFESAHQPQGAGDYLRNAARGGVELLLSPHSGAIRKVAIGANYRWSSNRLFSPDSPGQLTSENGFEVRGAADARLFGGMARLAGWLDGGSPSSANSSYRRVVGFGGYARDIPVGENQTFGIETLFGAGHAWGSVPQYAQFFGGNQGANFLYAGIDSAQLSSVPAGPVLRSYGMAQAGTGADGFWNFNLNVSVPIPKLSKPLIPAVDTPFGPMNQLMKKQAINSSKSFLTAYYKKQGADQKQAEAQAAADLKEITPAVTYLADYANIYALKPLFLMDVANVSGLTRKAVGGGIQLTIVVARFEAGYLRTVNPLPGENRGNFVLRLTFQNLF